ncbi:hypothetical protein [Clostridium intestinale]|uniref:hypothetical protein n=1 Tax=Clostridium intestinale TaxID=36845 RepID=UPI0028E66E3B|nr:hypothetical protein [Clostridium intestinale]
MLKKVICLSLLTVAIGSTVTNAASFNGSKGIYTNKGYVSAYTGAYAQSKATAKVVTQYDSAYAEDGALGDYRSSLWAQTREIKGTSGTHSHKVYDQSGGYIYDETNF